MPENAMCTILSNDNIAKDIYKMVLEGPTRALLLPGKFVEVKLEGFFLRRPISVCSWDETTLTFIYKVLGKGTAKMTQFVPNEKLDLLIGLGNGFDPASAAGKKVVLAGGGVGVPPLYGLAQALIQQGNTPTVALGFRSAADVFYKEEFEALGCPTHVVTEDGSAGTKGFVTTAMDAVDYDYYFTCGPGPMLRAVWQQGRAKNANGQLSFEERMGCGFGACMGCSCQTLVGAKRICMDGPVFPSGEVNFE